MFFAQRFSITKLFLIGIVSIVLVMTCVLWGEWYFQRNKEFTEAISKLEKSYISEQKKAISREVNSALEFIQFQRQQLEEQAKQQLKNRVYEAHTLATHLYERYRGSKSDAEIFGLITEALRSIRFNDGVGYFFVTRMDGTAVLFPFQPEQEGSNLLTFTDKNGLKVTQGMIKLVEQQREGFFKYAWWKPKQKDQHFDKVAFVKHFAPANWYIGTGIYLADLEQEIQQTVLKRIGDIRFGSDGFLFALDFESRMIAHPESKLIGNLMLDSKFKSIRDAFPEMISQTEQQGAFIEYSYRRPGHQTVSSKISYVARVPEWQWLIGAGFFRDTLEAAIADKRQQLNASINNDTKRMVLLSLLALGCSALIGRIISIKLKQNVALFSSFFSQAASQSTKIEERDVLFSEFEQLALAVNEMIEQRLRSEADRQQLEKQLLQHQKLEALGTLAGGIAHDFNNLLASICGNLTLLKMKLDRESELHKYLNRLDDATDNAKQLVAQILSFSRFSEDEKGTLDFTEAIKESLDLLRSSIPSSVMIETELAELSCPIQANKTQLHQVLMNLCSNAYQSLPDQSGRIRLTLSVKNSAELPQLHGHFGTAERIAHLAISDTGSGIAPELLEKIFDPFFSTKEQGKGTGLGLAIAHRIICNHHGLLNVESEPGIGSTFHVYLPLADDSEFTVAAPADNELMTGEGTILLVDDDQKVLVSTKELLQQVGYRVIAFDASDQALDYLQQHHETINVVITDQTMPGMNGIELIRNIRRFSYELPVILCTGYSDQIDENTSAELRLSHLLMKPVSIGQLSLHLHQLTSC